MPLFEMKQLGKVGSLFIQSRSLGETDLNSPAILPAQKKQFG